MIRQVDNIEWLGPPELHKELATVRMEAELEAYAFLRDRLRNFNEYLNDTKPENVPLSKVIDNLEFVRALLGTGRR